MLTSNYERTTQASTISTMGARFGTQSSIQHPKLARKYDIWVGCNSKNMGGNKRDQWVIGPGQTSTRD